jgi:hypothetical protein
VNLTIEIERQVEDEEAPDKVVIMAEGPTMHERNALLAFAQRCFFDDDNEEGSAE